MRTHYCGALRAGDAEKDVSLAGWVHRRRDHGGVIFLDVRDREGLVQVVLHPSEHPDAYAVGEKVRSEYVVSLKGRVRRRPPGAENPNIPTGEVEVAASHIDVIAEADTPPFPLDEVSDTNEETRLRYRYLDLRRPELQKVIRMRHQIIRAIRSFFDSEGFIEIETPMLTRATPEGARDFIVPSRLQPGTFFALPQSPQLFKQLLMISGFDRYYQIARCFRDEDPRADRQPDFTQLDVELSFVDEETVYDITERMFAKLFSEVLGVQLSRPFPRISYKEAIDTYGTDKPDLRFGLEFVDVTDVFRETEIKVFRPVIEAGGVAKALVVPGAGEMSRKELDVLTNEARNMRAGGLAWVIYSSDEISSPLAKFMSEKEAASLRATTNAAVADLVLIVCDRKGIAEPALGAVRLKVADLLGLRPGVPETDPDHWKFLWVVDPPLVEWNEDEKRWDPTHHPFTSPRPEHEPILESDPSAVLARCYDITLNGWELGSGSIRIHNPELQRRVFDLIGLDEETVRRRFGWFLKAFDYGAPPHGGIAPGIDRIVAMMTGKENIRDVIAFPKSGAYMDPLTSAPDAVDPEQLRELGLTLLPPE